MLATKREEIVARKAKEKQIRKPESVSAKLPKQTPVHTRAESAKAAKREEIVARRAKENIKTPTGGLTKAKLPKSQPAVNTRAESAKAAKREEIVARKAKENKVEAGKQTGRGNKKVPANLPTPFHTRAESAKAAGVGVEIVEHLMVIGRTSTAKGVKSAVPLCATFCASMGI